MAAMALRGAGVALAVDIQAGLLAPVISEHLGRETVHGRWGIDASGCGRARSRVMRRPKLVPKTGSGPVPRPERSRRSGGEAVAPPLDAGRSASFAGFAERVAGGLHDRWHSATLDYLDQQRLKGPCFPPRCCR
jgi:hypothetical protein